jgi:recombination protein RecR
VADPRLIDTLKQALTRLPGVGPRSAQRMAFHLLERDREGGRMIVDALSRALDSIGHCSRCNNVSERDLCPICSSSKRDGTLLCVVEAPADVDALEKTGSYDGMYFVLMGHVSPLDGIGPDQLGVDRLLALLDQGEVREVILATNLTVEGEATAHLLAELVRERGIRATRIAQGMQAGGELEYTDHNTLAHALRGRTAV